MTALPNKNVLDGTKVPATNTSEAQAAFAGLWDFVIAKLGSDSAIGTIASAATVNIGAAASQILTMTGTTGVTAFDNVAAGISRIVIYGGAVPITHNATSLILLDGASRTHTAGDCAEFLSLGGGNWREIKYQRAGGTVAKLDVVNTSTSGAVINMTGDGAATPKKSMRVKAGVLEWLDNAGNKIASLTDAGAFNAVVTGQTSDERKKKNWKRLPPDYLERLAGIRKSGLFQWKKKGGEVAIGVGAQSLEEILPQAVLTDEHGSKSVAYGAAAMVTCVELARELIKLRARVEQLEGDK